MEALEHHDSHQLGFCDFEAAENLEKIADLLDRQGRQPETPRLRFSPKPQASGPNQGLDGEPEIEVEWESTSAQLQAAIDAGVLEAIGSYLRDLAKLHRMRGKVLAPPPGFRGPRLEFVQRGRGRRPNSKNVWKDAAIYNALGMATLKLGKQEAAIEELKPTKSRATIFRAKRRFKSPSHKKR